MIPPINDIEFWHKAIYLLDNLAKRQNIEHDNWLLELKEGKGYKCFICDKEYIEPSDWSWDRRYARRRKHGVMHLKKSGLMVFL